MSQHLPIRLDRRAILRLVSASTISAALPAGLAKAATAPIAIWDSPNSTLDLALRIAKARSEGRTAISLSPAQVRMAERRLGSSLAVRRTLRAHGVSIDAIGPFANWQPTTAGSLAGEPMQQFNRRVGAGRMLTLAQQLGVRNIILTPADFARDDVDDVALALSWFAQRCRAEDLRCILPLPLPDDGVGGMLSEQVYRRVDEPTLELLAPLPARGNAFAPILAASCGSSDLHAHRDWFTFSRPET